MLFWNLVNSPFCPTPFSQGSHRLPVSVLGFLKGTVGTRLDFPWHVCGGVCQKAPALPGPPPWPRGAGSWGPVLWVLGGQSAPSHWELAGRVALASSTALLGLAPTLPLPIFGHSQVSCQLPLPGA